MPTDPCLRAAHALLLQGADKRERQPEREALFEAAGNLKYTTFRTAASAIGGYQRKPGLRFFDCTSNGWISFGPGAGVCVGVSVGARSVRAVLVDANGWEYAGEESAALDKQLSQDPSIVLDRVREAVQKVLRRGLEDDQLLVDGCLPLLGCSVAWPTPISRDRHPVGHGLSHPKWNNVPLDQRVMRSLNLGEIDTFVLSDAHAAAIAVAHKETRDPRYLEWKTPRLTVVLRLAGNISGAVIIIEHKKYDKMLGYVSGFPDSILLGGIDNMAGEIGHVPVAREAIEAINRNHVRGMNDMAPAECSCTPIGEDPPDHLEAYASVLALTRRLYPEDARGDALAAIRSSPNDTAHARALADIGGIVGETMLAPVAMLNPAGVVLTGSLALPTVADTLRDRLASAHKLGTPPDVDALSGDENDYIRAKGAALAMIRSNVHRRLEELFSTKNVDKIKELTKPIGPSDL